MTQETGKQRLLKTIHHEPTDRQPWVPLVGVHAGSLRGYSAREVLTQAHPLRKSLLAANQVYQADGLPVYFDIQVEAEILGCDLLWAEDTPPSVSRHPLAEEPNIPQILPTRGMGRLPLILTTMAEMKQRIGLHTALLGLVTGPLTLAYHLRGQKLFFDVMDAPAYVKELIHYTTLVAQRMASLYRDSGMDLIAVIEPVTSQVSPRSVDQFLTEPYGALFEYIHGLGAASMLHVCGNATRIIEPLCQTGAQVLSLDENVNLAEIQPIAEPFGTVLQGNIPVTTHLLQGEPADVRSYVSRLLETLPNPQNLILSPGCDLPWATPSKNIRAALEALQIQPRERTAEGAG